MNELADLREHLERYRSVTLQHFDLLTEDEFGWRPRPDAFSCGQQLLHIIQTEDCFIQGMFADDWQLDRLRLPKPMPDKEALRQLFVTVRTETLKRLDGMRDADLDIVKRHGFSPFEATLRSWLWFILEHEIHHKAQLAEYLRTLGKVPPYFAMVLPDGMRPDLQARLDLGGV
jgi:uncharacterized damage-inducible protein DinB